MEAIGILMHTLVAVTEVNSAYEAAEWGKLCSTDALESFVGYLG